MKIKNGSRVKRNDTFHVKTYVSKLLSVFALLLLSTVVLAETFTVNFKDADIKDLIKFVADATGYTVIIDPKVKGTVQLISKKPVSEKELYNLFLTVLHTHNFSAIKNGNVLRIIPNKSARSTSTPVRTRKPLIENHEYITQIIELKNVNATKLIPVLRPLVPQQGHMAAYADANAIIITDTADNVSKIYKIIESLDKTTVNEMEIFKLSHSSADEFVKIVDKIIKQPGSGGKSSSENKASIVADKRSNSLIVTGSEQQRLKVRRLIEALDGPLENSGNAQVISLKYAKATDLAPVLSKVSQSLSKIGGDSNGKNKSSSSASIEADEATNSLIITASGDLMESLTNIIVKLDVQRAQVLVEAIIVEIFETDGKALGVNWMAAGEKSGFAGSVHQEGILGAIAQGAFEDDDDDAVKGIAAALSNLSGGVLGGANFDVAGTSFVALLTALETSQEANVLSTPSLMTLDNSEAQIVVGQEVPFVTGSYTSTGSGSSNPSDPFQTVERKNVGITLKVTPHVNEGNQITLEILQEVSGLVGATVDPTVPTITNERKVETTVTTGDGETIIIGGLMSDEVQETVSKVPLLGDIPFIGRLFRSSSTTTVKKNLMIFIRPTVIRSSQLALEVSQNQYRRVRDVQLYKERRGVDLFKDQVLPVLPHWEEQLGGAHVVQASGTYEIADDELTEKEEIEQAEAREDLEVESSETGAIHAIDDLGATEVIVPNNDSVLLMDETVLETTDLIDRPIDTESNSEVDRPDANSIKNPELEMAPITAPAEQQ